MKILNCVLIIVIVLISAPATHVVGVSNSHSIRATDPQEISITCPAEIAYPIQPIADWQPGFYAVKRLMFAEASVNGRTLFCSYSVNNGAMRDYSTLSRDMPPGYICTLYNSGSKGRQFSCKRAVAPIKIKPKSE